jgi:thioredoxin 1
MASEKVVMLKSTEFDDVIKSAQPVLVDFWAAWCGPCRMLGPTIEQLAEDYEGKAKICKLNVDEEGEIAQRFKIMSIPTVMVFKNGLAVDKVVGVRNKKEYETILDKAI